MARFLDAERIAIYTAPGMPTYQSFVERSASSVSRVWFIVCHAAAWLSRVYVLENALSRWCRD